MYVLIQENDIKSKMLADEMKDIEMYIMKGSTNLIPFNIVKQIVKRKKKPKALILRYLNDSDTFIKSIIRLLSNVISVILTKLLRIKLIWICHNVDKESREYYPFLVKFRRKIMTRFSDKIFVTDQLLVKHAIRFLNVDKSKVDYITFGKPVLNNIGADDDIHKKIIEFVTNNDCNNTLIGLSIGNPNLKVLHPFYTNEVIDKAAEHGFNLKIILGGPLSDFIENQDPSTYEKLLSNPNVLFLDGKIKLDEQYISKYVDFYWRVYDDYSVPYTVYNAVFLNKPILTMNKGFLKEMVIEYRLGSVLENDLSNIVESLNGLIQISPDSFKEFINTHNWAIGSNQLLNYIMKR